MNIDLHQVLLACHTIDISIMIVDLINQNLYFIAALSENGVDDKVTEVSHIIHKLGQRDSLWSHLIDLFPELSSLCLLMDHLVHCHYLCLLGRVEDQDLLIRFSCVVVIDMKGILEEVMGLEVEDPNHVIFFYLVIHFGVRFSENYFTEDLVVRNVQLIIILNGINNSDFEY